MFNIIERFVTISGEAPIIGEPIYLIRFSGCNLLCPYCDTDYKDEINEVITVDNLIIEIENIIKEYPDLKVLFTGGEPLLEERKEQLYLVMKSLDKIDFFIETNGSIEIEHFDLENSHYIIDWKTPSSHSSDFFLESNLKKMRFTNDIIKFVVDKNDLLWVKEKVEFIQKINPFVKMYISPQYGKITLREIADFILRNRLPLNISIQLHKLIWPDKNRGV